MKIKHPFGSADEVTHVVVRMKGDEVGSQESVEDFSTFRKHTKEFVRGEWDMVEVTDTYISDGTPKHLRQEHQVIILYPYDITGLDMKLANLREDLVDLFVGLPVLAFIFDKGEEVVAERPDDTVGITFIIVFYLVWFKKDGMIVEGIEVFCNCFPFIFFVCVDTGPSDLVLFHSTRHRLKTCGKSTFATRKLKLTRV